MAVRRDYEELTVITKTYDLILWSCNRQVSQESPLRAGRTDRTEPLRPAGDIDPGQIHPATSALANLMLEILRFQMRLAKDLQCLKVESYGFAAKAIDEIGQLVGGWLKSSGKA
jgi:hypothetical protein